MSSEKLDIITPSGELAEVDGDKKEELQEVRLEPDMNQSE